MARPGIRDLVGRAMIDKDFLADLVRDPALVLAELRSVVRGARGHHAGGGQGPGGSTERERARALQVVLMKRWAT